jgi:hypothetical protein
LSAGISAEPSIGQARDHLKFEYRFDRLWDKRDESLTARADLFVVIVGSIDSEIVFTAASSVDRKLSGRSESRAIC